MNPEEDDAIGNVPISVAISRATAGASSGWSPSSPWAPLISSRSAEPASRGVCDSARPGQRTAAAVAIVAVYMVVFASDPLSPVSALQNGRLEVGLLALGAAVLWASGTVLGRFALGSISFWSMTALRFTLALPVLVIIVLVQSGLGGFGHYRVSDFVPNLLAIALVPGLLALLLYYRALSKTPASMATIAEMAYPVAATLIASAPPPWGFSQPIYATQIVGTVLLLGVIVFLNWTREKAPAVVARPLTVAET